jgi:hypothetical protein
MHGFGRKKLKGEGHSEDIGLDGKIILEWILEKQGGKLWTRFTWPRVGTTGELL